MSWRIDHAGPMFGREIDLITADKFASVPDGTALVSILGEVRFKGIDYIDQDTRGGYLAYGLLVPLTAGALTEGTGT